MERTISKICTKRLNGDLRLLAKEPLDNIETYPDEDNILIWYFLIKGPEDSPYNNGLYIGKILHNPEYPLKPPDFMMLTPNGRFSINKKICILNFSTLIGKKHYMYVFWDFERRRGGGVKVRKFP